MRNFKYFFSAVFDFNFFRIFSGFSHFFLDFAKSMTFHRGISRSYEQFIANNFSRTKPELWKIHRLNFIKKYFRIWKIDFFENHSRGPPYFRLFFSLDFAKSTTFHRGRSRGWEKFIANHFSRMKPDLWSTHHTNFVKKYFRIWEIYFSENHKNSLSQKMSSFREKVDFSQKVDFSPGSQKSYLERQYSMENSIKTCFAVF